MRACVIIALCNVVRSLGNDLNVLKEANRLIGTGVYPSGGVRRLDYDYLNPPTLPNLPPVVPKGGVGIWATQPDPVDLGYREGDFWYDVDLQSELGAEGWGVWWGDWKGFPDWRYCLATCQENPKCTHWVFLFDPTSFGEYQGGCYFKTGIYFIGTLSWEGLQSIASSVHIAPPPTAAPPSDPVIDFDPASNTAEGCYEPGFVYQDNWISPVVLELYKNVTSIQECHDLCENYIGNGTLPPPTLGPVPKPPEDGLRGLEPSTRSKRTTGSDQSRALADGSGACIAWQYDNAPYQIGWNSSRYCTLLGTYWGKRQSNPWSIGAPRDCDADLTENFPTMVDPQAGPPEKVYPEDEIPNCYQIGSAIVGEPIDQAYGPAIIAWALSLSECHRHCEGAVDPTALNITETQCVGASYSPIFGACYLYKKVTRMYSDVAMQTSFPDGSEYCEGQTRRRTKQDNRELKDRQRQLQSFDELTPDQQEMVTHCEEFGAVGSIEPNVDYVGYDLEYPSSAHGYWFVNSPMNCFLLCRSIFGCLFWTHDAALNICWLKENASGRAPVRAFGVITSGPSTCFGHGNGLDPKKAELGSRQPEPEGECIGKIVEGVDFNFEDTLRTITTMDEWTSCQDECFKTSECTHFVFTLHPWEFATTKTGYCYLKSLADPLDGPPEPTVVPPEPTVMPSELPSTDESEAPPRRLMDESTDPQCHWLEISPIKSGVTSFAGPASCTERRRCSDPPATTGPPQPTTEARTTTENLPSTTEPATEPATSTKVAPTTTTEAATTVAATTEAATTETMTSTATIPAGMIMALSGRLMDQDINDTGGDFQQRFKAAAASDMDLTMNEVVIVQITEGSTIVDWTPPGDVDDYVDRWAESVETPDSALGQNWDLDRGWPPARLVRKPQATTTATPPSSTMSTKPAECDVTDFECQSSTALPPDESGLGAGAITGIAVGSVAGVLAIAGGAYYVTRKSREKRLATNAVQSSPGAGGPVGQPGAAEGGVTPGALESGS